MSAGLEFAIPLNKEDLLQIGAPGQYVVEQSYNKNELPGKLRDAYVSFSRMGPAFIVAHFDVLYSALLKFGELAPTHQAEAWKIVSQAIQQLNGELDQQLGAEEYDQETRQELVTITKMTVYLLCSFLEAFETRNLAVPGATDGKGGRKKKRPEADGCCDLEAERNFALVSLDALIQMPIHKLWSPPVVEQDFVNLVSNLCYKVLENPVISHVRMKGTREAVFRVIAMLVKRYNHGLSCTLKIIQLLQHFEHAVPACVHGLATMIEYVGCSGMVVDLVREIGRVDPRDLARDTSSSRNYAAFLAELAERVPAAFLPCVSLLSVHLEEESHTMRNSVLSIFAEIVLQELSGEDLDEKKRDLRDQLLEPLLEHLHDVHSFVRSKALQLWHKLCVRQAIPLSLQHRVLSLTTERLADKTSTVRKNAIQLLIALMQGNPYASRLPLKQLESQLQIEQAKLDELIQIKNKDKPARPQIDPTKCGPTRTELWNAMEPEVLVAIHEVLSGEPASDGDTEVGELEDARVIELLNAGNYKEPTRMLIRASAEEDDEEDEEKEEPEAEDILDKLRQIYVGNEEAVQAEKEREQMVREAVEEDVRSQENDSEQPAEEDTKEIAQQRVLVLYLKDSQAFASSVHTAIPVVCQLLCSKQTSDILEAIDFFVTAFEFDVLDAMVGVRRMLSLVWSSEPEVKTAVVNAYKRLYMNMENPSKRKAIAVVSNLTALISSSTQGELASLEELISLCVKSGDLPKPCVQVMWERFSMTLPETTEEESRSALMLLAMVSSAQVQVVTSNVNVLVSVGLGERGARDFRLAHLTCAVLLKMAPSKTAAAQQPQGQDGQCSAPPPVMRFPPSHEIFERTTHLLVDGLTRIEDVHYSQFAVSAVALTYALAEHPDTILGDVLKTMCKTVYKTSQDLPGTGENGELEVAAPILTRILVIAGQVAIRQLVHLDVHVYSELRRRAKVREEKLEEASTQRKRNQLIQSASRRRASSARPVQLQSESDAGEDDELVGAVADDDEAEYVRKICETEIVTGGSSFLSLLAPLVVAVNANPAKYRDPALRAAAALCLAEFMLVSQSFCMDHLRLLFTVLERSPEEVIRSNLVIALGDLNFRFPNQIEPWTPHLYGRLRDSSSIVKRTTLNVLTHLILNDMVKVKGQISDIALCIIDPDPRISGMSRMFFSEFARKGNALYNVMPDIISRLCDPEAQVDEDDFATILKWIMALIQKEKQSESLVEKIVLRLGASRTDRQSRDLMFCLSLLTFNERSLRRLLEHWNCLSDKIHQPAVGDTLNSILASAKKLAKPEVRSLVEEIEAKIQETLEADEDEQQVVRKAQAAAASAKTPTKGNKGRRKRPTKASSSEEENDAEEDMSVDEDDANEPGQEPVDKKPSKAFLAAHPAHTPLKPPQSQRKKKPSGRKKNSSDAEEEEAASRSRSVRNTTTRRRVVAPEPSDEEDDEFEKPAPRSNRGNATTSKSSEKRPTRSRR